MRPAALMWKFWVAGNEVYATNRAGGHLVKISMHESGQIHMHLGKGKPKLLARPLPMGSGAWLHGLEVRFLLSPGASRPPPEDLKGKKAYLVDVPEGHYAILNVLIATEGSSELQIMPHELSGSAQPIWHARLRSGRSVVLVARVAELDEDNREAIRFVREELTPKANFASKPSSPPYVEIRNVHWSVHGGNVALIIPMGREGYTFPTAQQQSSSLGLPNGET